MSLVLLILVIAPQVQTVSASNTATNPPSTSSAVPSGANINVGATSFGNPGNAFFSDNNYAKAQNSYAEVYGGFGFNIASGSTINGIVLTLEANVGNCTGTANKQFRVYVSNDGLNFNAPAGGGGSTGDLGSSDTTSTFGSSTNLWGLTWTVSQANSVNVMVQAQCSGGGNQTGHVLDLDYLTLTIYYTAPTTTSSTTNALCGTGAVILPHTSPPGNWLVAPQILPGAVLIAAVAASVYPKHPRARSKKGVAPVIATILIIAVAAAMSVILFSWSQGYFSNASGAVGSQQGAQNQAAQSGIAIESVTFIAGTSGSNGANTPQITIIVRNVGAVTSSLGSVSAVGSSSNAGFKGSLTQGSLSTSGSRPLTSSDGTWTYTLNAASISKGSCGGLILTQGSASATIPLTQVLSGDVLDIKVTTTVGTFAEGQFNVP